MSLTFANFKKTIQPQMLTRGRTYLKEGQILDLTFEEDSFLWEAKVAGSEVYDVTVKMFDSAELLCTCTCPYELGTCKHVAAVLYAIEDTFPDQLGTKPRKKQAKRETRHDKLRRLLDKAPQDELKAIILSITEKDRDLLNQLIVLLEPGEVKTADYRRMIKDALRVGRDSYGFLDYSGSNRAARKLSELVAQAEQWRRTHQADKAIGLYQALLDEAVPAIAHADDSSGMLGDCLHASVAGLKACVPLLSDHERTLLLMYCLERGRNPEFLGWDWGWDLLKLAIGLVDTPEKRMLYETSLEETENKVREQNRKRGYEPDDGFSATRILLLRLELINRFDDKKAVDKFLRANTAYDDIRKILIERCLQEGLLDEAEKYIQEGVKVSEKKRYWGLVHAYKVLHIKLIQHRGDQKALIKATRETWLRFQDEDLYALLEQTVPAAEWQAFVEDLIKNLPKSPRSEEAVIWVYAREGRWDDLISQIMKSSHAVGLMRPYAKEITTRFPDKVVAIYERTADDLLKNASGRSHYRDAVAYLTEIRKLTSRDYVDQIVERIRKQYAHRSALLDELKHV